MFDGLKILSIIVAAKELIKEATEKPTPEGAWFDHEAFYKDSATLSPKALEKRMKKRYYWRTDEKKRFNLKKYYEDVLAGMSADELESRRLSGAYGADRPKWYGQLDMNYDENESPEGRIIDVCRFEHDLRYSC